MFVFADQEYAWLSCTAWSAKWRKTNKARWVQPSALYPHSSLVQKFSVEEEEVNLHMMKREPAVRVNFWTFDNNQKVHVDNEPQDKFYVTSLVACNNKIKTDKNYWSNKY